MPVYHRPGNTNQSAVLSQNVRNPDMEWRPIIHKLVVALTAHNLQLVARRNSHNNSYGCDGHTMPANFYVGLGFCI